MTPGSKANFFNDSNIANTLSTRELLVAFTHLFSQAQLFFQHSAEQTDSGNLRRHYSSLARLHQQVLYLLPRGHHHDRLPAFPNCSELCHWYQNALQERATPNKTNQPQLHNIQTQLQKQLQLQKSMIRACQPGQHQISLLHFTASLQIAADQLADTTNHSETFTDQPPQNYNQKINIK